MDAWPDALRAQVPGLTAIPLEQDDLIWMCQRIPGFLERTNSDPVDGPSHSFIAALEDHFSAHPYRHHARLGLGSFRQGRGPVMPIADTTGMLTVMGGYNARLASLVAPQLAAGQDMNLFLRPWYDIPLWGEFRAFYHSGRIIGVTQIDPRPIWPEIAMREDEIRMAIAARLRSIAPHLHVEKAVLDLMLTDEPDQLLAHLIEINPFIQRSHPGLFDWNTPEHFDGRFLYNRASTS